MPRTGQSRLPYLHNQPTLFIHVNNYTETGHSVCFEELVKTHLDRAIQCNPRNAIISAVSPHMTESRWHQAILLNNYLFRNIPPEYINDGLYQLLLEPLNTREITFKSLPVQFHTRKMAIKSIDQNNWTLSSPFTTIPKHLIDGGVDGDGDGDADAGDIDNAIKRVIRKYPNWIKTLPLTIQSKLIEEWIALDPMNLRWFSSKIITSDLCQKAYQLNKQTVVHIPWRHLTQENVNDIITHVQLEYEYQSNQDQDNKYLDALHHIPYHFRKIEFYSIVFASGRLGLKDVTEKHRTREICDLALKFDKFALPNIPEHIRSDSDYLIAVQMYPAYIILLPKRLQTKQLWTQAIDSECRDFYDLMVPKQYQTGTKSTYCSYNCDWR